MKPKLLILFLFFTPFCYAYNTINYKVEGKLIGQLKGKYAYLQIFSNPFQKAQLIEVNIVNGSFVFSGVAKHGEDQTCGARLFISNKAGFTTKTIVDLIKLQNYDMRSLVLEKLVKVTIDNSVKTSLVRDGELNDINNLYHEAQFNRELVWDNARKKFDNDMLKFKDDADKKQEATAEYYAVMMENEKEYLAKEFDLIRRYPLAKQSRIRLRGYFEANKIMVKGSYTQELKELWKDLPAEYTNSEEAQKNLKLLAETSDDKKLKNGSMIPDYTFNTGKGAPLSIKSYRGKYILIDFWTSWCGPCRGEHYYMKKAFEKFQSMDFTILQVSLDKDEQKWMKAINEEKLPWTNFRCLRGWDKEVVELFDIKGVPTNYLVGPDGTIIARDLRRDELEKKLLEIFAKK